MPEPGLIGAIPSALMAQAARAYAGKVALRYGEQSWTFAEFDAAADRLASGLVRRVAPAERVIVLMANRPEYVLLQCAIERAGLVRVPVNARSTAHEIDVILADCEPAVLFYDRTTADRVPAANGEAALWRLQVDGDAARGGASYGELSAETIDRSRLERATLDDLSSINYTSGTTGRPRGVIYTHRGAYLNCFGEIIHSRHDENSVYLWTLPMFHCNGWCTPWALTAIGGTHVCLREVRGDAIWDQLREHDVTHLNAAPTVVSTILNARDTGPLTRPVLITTAGAPPSPTTIAHMERMGFQIVHVYGLTETYGPISFCQSQPEWAGLSADERSVLQARQGVSMIQAEGLRVVDAEMADVPADGSTMGEIVMHGNNVMAGYYLDPDATAEAFRGGWFHSGDLGVMHPDGYIELRDRSKDVVISGGENISTIEVEQALMSHPAVLEAAVIGVPDDKWGERPKAFVVLHAGQSATPQELIAHVRAKIASYKAPRDIEITFELPKTSTGKIQKFVLRDSEWAGRIHRVHG